MAKIVSNNFVLNAMISGKTLVTAVRTVEGVFVQSMDVNGNLSPDWTNAGPKFKASVRDTGGITHLSLPAEEKRSEAPG